MSWSSAAAGSSLDGAGEQAADEVALQGEEHAAAARTIETNAAAVSRCHDWPRVPDDLDQLGDERQVLGAAEDRARSAGRSRST